MTFRPLLLWIIYIIYTKPLSNILILNWSWTITENFDSFSIYFKTNWSQLFWDRGYKVVYDSILKVWCLYNCVKTIHIYPCLLFNLFVRSTKLSTWNSWRYLSWKVHVLLTDSSKYTVLNGQEHMMTLDSNHFSSVHSRTFFVYSNVAAFLYI